MKKVSLIVILSAHAAAAQSSTDLAKASQNPVGDLTSVPLQFNYSTGGGLAGQTLFNLNVQPVVPLAIGKQWNIIARTIVPFFNVPVSSTDRAKGVGDIQEQLFFTKQKPGAVIWGVGPIFSFPTATNVAIHTGDWAAGPTAVVARTTGPWLFGTLASQLWTFATNNEPRDVDQLLLQPFVNYNLADGWAIVSAPIITADWTAESGEEWTVPLGLAISKVTHVGKQPLSLAVHYYTNVVRPSSGPTGQLKLVVSFLFPKAP